MLDRGSEAGTTLIVLDQTPFIEEALDACQRARRRIDELKAELLRFERVDRPGYERWYHSAFGNTLTSIREHHVLLSGKESELASARKRHWARFFGSSDDSPSESTLGRDNSEEGGFCGAHATWTSYEEVISDFEEDEFGPETESHEFQDDGFFDDEREFHFWENAESARRFEDLFVRRSRDGGYTRSRGHSYRDEDHEKTRSSSSGPRSGRASDGSDQTSEDPAGRQDFGAAASEPGKDDLHSRVKERYRALVRRLHPDTNSELTQEERSLWHQVQAAYNERDLEKLDLLLVLSDAFSGRVTGASTLDSLRRAAREIEKFTAPLRRKIEEAKKDRAWNFSGIVDLGPLHRAVERELQRDLHQLQTRIRQLDQEISRFSRGAPLNRGGLPAQGLDT